MISSRSQAGVSPAEQQRAEEVDRMAALGKDGVASLMAMLEDRAWTVRRAVVAALGALGDDAVPALCSSLQTERDDEGRIAATVDALVASTGGVEPAVSALADDDNSAVAADVAQILGRRRSIVSVPTLVRLSQHADDNVAVAAIEALGRVGGRSAVDALVDAVRTNNFFRAFPAIDVLGRSGDPRAVAPLAELLGNPQYALEAARSLGRTADRGAVAPLVTLLASPADGNVRVAAQALAELVERHKELYGAGTAIEEALKRAVTDGAVRRLGQALVGADAAEQIAICTVLGSIGHEGAPPILVRMLHATGPVASAAGQALRKFGREADRELLRALREGDSERRRALLPSVVRGTSATDVITCLKDPDAGVRAAACDVLARLGNPVAVHELFTLLQDTNPRVVQAATGAIQSLGAKETFALAAEAARSPSPSVRRAAHRVLAYAGEARALPLFTDALKDPDPRVRDSAIQGLAFVENAAALDVLLDVAKDLDPRSRAAAVRALGQCSEQPRVTAALLRALADDDAWVRYYACQSLGKHALEVAADAIARRLHEDDAGQVRVAAVEALSHLQGARAFEALKEAANGADVDVQRAALIGLGMARRSEALTILLEAAVAEDAITRLVALSALSGYPPPQVLHVLARAVTDADESVRTAAVGFLAALPGVDATKVLIGFLHDPRYATGQERQRILDALAGSVHGRIAGILAVLEVTDDETALALTSTLARLDRADATAALHQALHMAHVPARKAAATALAATGSRSALDALRTLATDDSSLEVRRVCTLLLAQ